MKNKKEEVVLKQNLVDTTTHIQLNDEGNIIGLKGKFKVSDLREKVEVQDFYDENIFVELGIRRMN